MLCSFVMSLDACMLLSMLMCFPCENDSVYTAEGTFYVVKFHSYPLPQCIGCFHSFDE